MNLDIRSPIGLLFISLGSLLLIYGFLTRADPAIYERSLGLNINLWWGSIMTVFGVIILASAKKLIFFSKNERTL